MSTDIPAKPGAAVSRKTIRGQRVILDSDLAKIYRVKTKRFNEAVTRNAGRFPTDFMFQLTRQEVTNLKSQIATSSSTHGGVRKLPRAFTEHGAVMAANVVLAFLRMREELSTHGTILRRLSDIEKTLLVHDSALRELFAKLRPLLSPPPEKPKVKIGFHQGNR